eukprot:15366421-Ditylum_brightwellii.AAC.1
MQYLHHKDHAFNFTTQISASLFILAALIFIDDSDLLVTAPNLSPNYRDCIILLQNAVNTWKGGLIVTGGSLKPSKAHFQVVGHKWQDRKWTYQCASPKPTITIKGTDNTNHKIKYLEHDETVRAVGIWQAPDGNMRKKVEVLTKTAEHWSTTLISSGSPLHLANIQLTNVFG